MGSIVEGWTGHRAVDEFECVASTLLAILAAHAVGAGHVSWAAFSGYIVMRGHAAETVTRAVLRMIGTALGGLLALVAAPVLLGSRVAAAAALLTVGTGSLYGAITAKRAYAWLLFGLTFAMVILDRIADPAVAPARFVQARVTEVAAGTAACVVVSLLSTATLRRRWPAPRAGRPAGLGWQPHAFRHAAQAGVALAILVLLTAVRPVPALAQSAVTIMAVMLVPASGIGPSGLAPVSRRLLHRFVGCLAGAALAAAVLLLARGSVPVLLAGTAAGVAAGRHLENGDHPLRYVGVQFTLAVLVVLVPDSEAGGAIRPGLERLGSILIGMAVLEPILLAWHALSPARGRALAV